MKTIIVLGMHRSATSLIAKGLDHEISMGENMLGKHPSQPNGHYENVAAIKLNEQILRAAGGSYLNPPTEKAILALADEFKDQIKAFVRKASQDENGEPFAIWGWKDPRTTLTVRLFLPHVENPHLVCCFRDPGEVALSLQRRSDCNVAKGLLLAREYNRRLVKLLQEIYV